MPIPGDRKFAYCPICGHETSWEYIIIQLDDGVFGIENAIDPANHQIRVWRCTQHTTPEGKIREGFRKKHRTHLPAEVG